MIESLTLKNVGAMPENTITFGTRLNIITGDNGLGKSFLLDIIWYALTNRWPWDVNDTMTSGYMARPMNVEKDASIEACLRSKNGTSTASITAAYQRQYERWASKHPQNTPVGLVLYAHYDGSFSVWDPQRNYWVQTPNESLQGRQPAFVLTPSEVWNGVEIEQNGSGKRIPICNGLIRDWVSWQDRGNNEFRVLTDVLEKLSPPDMSILPLPHDRISTKDSREHPFVQMPYGAIPAVWTSAGIRRILALAYMLTWTLTEHLKTCKVLGQKPSKHMIFLFDEVDSHLHPKWQRQIMNGIMEVLEGYASVARGNLYSQMAFFDNLDGAVQIIAVTHSPLVMASLESIFDPNCDQWLDMDADENGKICIAKRDFEKKGNAEDWLTSQAFDLNSAYSLEAEKAMNEASQLLKADSLNEQAIREAYQKLLVTLSSKDVFLMRFRYLCEKKGVHLQ